MGNWCVPDTPPSLLIRLRDRDDGRSWQQFFDQYWRLIYSFARRSGLSPSDAEDVVQEVVTEVFKALPTFNYERTRGTFRAWLRKITQHKIADHLRKTARGQVVRAALPEDASAVACEPVARSSSDASHRQFATTSGHAHSPSVHGGNGQRVPPDPADVVAEQMWEEDWRRNLLQVCLDRVREEIEPKTFQAFQLYALDGWSAKEAAEFLGLSVASVYAAKSRVAERVRHWWNKEVGEDESG